MNKLKKVWEVMFWPEMRGWTGMTLFLLLWIPIVIIFKHYGYVFPVWSAFIIGFLGYFAFRALIVLIDEKWNFSKTQPQQDNQHEL